MLMFGSMYPLHCFKNLTETHCPILSSGLRLAYGNHTMNTIDTHVISCMTYTTKKIRVMASLPNQNSFCGPIQTINRKCRYYITEKKTAVKTYGTNLTEKNRIMSSN